MSSVLSIRMSSCTTLLTPKFELTDPYKTLMNSNITQLSGAGN